MNWQDAINDTEDKLKDAEKELKEVKAQIRRLKAALSTFKDNSARGVPFPGTMDKETLP